MIKAEDLNSILYEYRIDQIALSDEGVKQEAIDAAVSEVRSYLSGRFDCDKIFAAEVMDVLVARHVKIIAVKNLLILSNVDTITSMFGEYYKAAIEWLKQAARGQVSPDLPTKEGEVIPGSIMFGSMKKNVNDY